MDLSKEIGNVGSLSNLPDPQVMFVQSIQDAVTRKKKGFCFVYLLYPIIDHTGHKKEGCYPHDLQNELLLDGAHQGKVVKEKNLHNIIVRHHAC